MVMSPVTVGTLGVINSLLVSTMSCGEYVMVPGGASIIVRLMVVDDEPLALVAVIVYIVGVNCKSVGVPLITPLLKVRPFGSVDGQIVHVVGAPIIPLAALLTWYNPVMPLVLIDEKYKELAIRSLHSIFKLNSKKK